MRPKTAVLIATAALYLAGCAPSAPPAPGPVPLPISPPASPDSGESSAVREMAPVSEELLYNSDVGYFDEAAIEEELLQVAGACLPLYREIDRSYDIFIPTDAQKQALYEAIGALGHPAGGKDTDMLHYQQAVDFCSLVSQQGTGNLGIYIWSGGLVRLSFHAEEGVVYKTEAALDWTEDFEPVITIIESFAPQNAFRLTEKGWLFFGKSADAWMNLSDNPSGHFSYLTGLRVLPLGAENRQMLRYLEPLGSYGGHNLLIYSWDDLSHPGYNDLFDILYCYEHGQNPDAVYRASYDPSTAYIRAVPEADFEALILKYFPIAPQSLREVAVYDPQRQVYAMDQLTTPGYSPLWEVVGYQTNDDGTITLTVDAVDTRRGQDQAAVNHLTVQPRPDGSFYYISNLLEVTGDSHSLPAYYPRVAK